VTVSKGTAGGGMKTVIGDDCLIMAGAHIAHDCIIADHVVIGNNTQLAGHIQIGRKAIVSGMVGVHHFVTIGELAFVGAMSAIRTDVPPYVIVDGNPAEVRTVNVIGLRRNGFDEETTRNLKDVFRTLFHDRGTSKADALAKLRADTTLKGGSPVRQLCDWVGRQLEVSIKGRLQEAFRQPAEHGLAATSVPAAG
jgi:UDP-N-acetylglucosamine acyltransferase